jgi:hypothetical protein
MATSLVGLHFAHPPLFNGGLAGSELGNYKLIDFS